MKRRSFLPVLPGLLCGGRAFGAAAVKSLDDLIRPHVEAGIVAAAAIQVQRGGDTVFRRAFGKGATVDSMFLLGSITKPITAIAAMVLSDRGELKLSDPAVKYLPEFSEGERKRVTIEQLLVHTSGLPDQLPDNNALRARHAPLSEFVAGACRTPLLFSPGTKYHYQSMGILLAAEIVERVSGQKLPAFLEKEVFAPLGMAGSVFGLGKFQKSDFVAMQTERAAPESGAGDPNAKSWNWNSDYWRNLGAPWGGGHSSVGDLTTLLRLFLHPDGRVLRPETASLMVRNHTAGLEADRGIGFQLGAALGKGCSPRAFGHPGSTGTLAWADPETDTSFVLLTSLPRNVSGALLLGPASDLVSAME